MTGVCAFAKRTRGVRGNGGEERLPTRATTPKLASLQVRLGLAASRKAITPETFAERDRQAPFVTGMCGRIDEQESRLLITDDRREQQQTMMEKCNGHYQRRIKCVVSDSCLALTFEGL